MTEYFKGDVRIDAKSFKSFMKELKTNVSNMSPPFKEYARYIKNETDSQFQKEVDPEGRPWRALAPSTIRRKKTNFKLRESFKMSRSFYTDVDKNSVSYGLKDPKYRFHHNGVLSRNLPARVVIGDTQQRRGVLNKMIVKYLRTKRAGRR